MKNKISIKWLIAVFVISITAFSESSYAQTRLPDGTVVYQDGTVRLPNGQVRYPNNTNGTTYPSNYPDYGVGRYPRTSTRQSDGSIIYPDGRIVYPDGTIRYPDGRVYSRSRNSRWIPPGQAKKMYGSKSARQYAPGHNKKRDRDYEDDNDNDKGWKNNKVHGKGKHGNGKHGHDD
ncbi:MAG: hypothetical protein ABIQ07_08850 [Ginsengibacter sp.]